MNQETDSENSLTPPRPNPPITPLHDSFGKGVRHPKRPISKRPQNDQATSRRPQNDLKTTPPTSKRPQNDLKTTRRPQNDLKTTSKTTSKRPQNDQATSKRPQNDLRDLKTTSKRPWCRFLVDLRSIFGRQVVLRSFLRSFSGRLAHTFRFSSRNVESSSTSGVCRSSAAPPPYPSFHPSPSNPRFSCFHQPNPNFLLLTAPAPTHSYPISSCPRSVASSTRWLDIDCSRRFRPWTLRWIWAYLPMFTFVRSRAVASLISSSIDVLQSKGGLFYPFAAAISHIHLAITAECFTHSLHSKNIFPQS